MTGNGGLPLARVHPQPDPTETVQCQSQSAVSHGKSVHTAKNAARAPRPVCFVLPSYCRLINRAYTASPLLFTISSPSMTEPHVDAPVHSDSFEQRLRERE